MSASNETPGAASRMGDTDRPGSDIGTTARTDLEGITQEVKHQAEALGEEAKAQIADAARRAKTMASEQKDLIAVQLSGVVNAIEKVAMELEQNNESTAPYMRMIADRAQSLSSAVRSNNVDDLMSMAQDFGRRQPVAFMGLAAIMGFAASRFVRASASRRAEQSMTEDQYGEGPDYGSASYGSESYGTGLSGTSGRTGSSLSGSAGMGAGLSGTGMGSSGLSGGSGSAGRTGSSGSGLATDPSSGSGMSGGTGGQGTTGGSSRSSGAFGSTTADADDQSGSSGTGGANE